MTDIEARIDAAANELCNDELRPADEIRDILRKHFYAAVVEKDAEIERLNRQMLGQVVDWMPDDATLIRIEKLIGITQQLADLKAKSETVKS